MHEFRLPDVGEGLHEAEVLRWLVQPGDPVRVDQPMVEVQTDKAVVEIGSPIAATVGQLHVREGERVPVGTLLVTLVPAGEAAPTPVAAAVAAAVAVAPAGPRLLDEDGRPVLLAAPSVRKAARDLGVDLWVVRGTGPAGRVTMADLQAHVAAAAAAPRLTIVPPAPVPAPVPVPTPGKEEVVPLQGLRRRIAERMTESWRTIPHVTAQEDADATRLADLRERLLPAAEAQGVKLTYLPLVIKAVVVALKEHPYLNATFDETGGAIRLKRHYHIGIATATPDGLLVPVLRDADQKSILAIGAELQRLAEGARSRKLAPVELTGSTFTITNFGAYGGTRGTPIINPPEVAILGIGKVADRPVVVNGQVVVRPVLPVSLSFDHRVVDGEGAGRFLNRLLALLAEPERLLLEMV